MSTNTFIQKARNIHGDKFDYSHVEYINAKTPVKIWCYQHGFFFQQPYLHVNKQRQCPDCAYEQRAKTRKNNNKWVPYKQAKAFVQSLNLSSVKQWNEYCKSGKKPNYIPACPKVTYKNEWEGWEQWIGTNGKTKDFLSFEQSKKEIQKYNIKSYEQWINFCRQGKRPNNIPFMPKEVYAEQWKGWGDWLGVSNCVNGNQPGIVYIIQQTNLPFNIVKIGRTYRLDKRLYEHQRITQSNFIVIKQFHVKNMDKFERIAHNLAHQHGEQYKYQHYTEYFYIRNLYDFIDELNNRKRGLETL